MPLYTSSYFKRLAAKKKHILIGGEDKLESFDIFLSHSFLDQEEVNGISDEFSLNRYTVYLDWKQDSHLDRNNVTKDAANLIRNRMKTSKSLVFAISSNALMSKWMPWELGFMDGFTGKCTILPISEHDMFVDKFERSEYLTLYPYIFYNDMGTKPIPFVREVDGKEVLFDAWLKRIEK